MLILSVIYCIIIVFFVLTFLSCCFVQDTGDVTPAGVCKESGCDAGVDNQGGVRTNNVPICPITSVNNNGYVTMGSGGLFVLKLGKMLTQKYFANIVYYLLLYFDKIKNLTLF